MRIPPYITLPVLTGLSMGVMHMSIPPVADQFMTVFGVKHGGLSILMSSLFWTHSICQVPAGLLIDRLGTWQGLVFAFSLSLIGLVGPLFDPHSFTLAVAMRMVLGVSTAFTFLASLKALLLMAPPQHMARAQGLQGAAFCLGTMLPYVILPLFGETGWVWSYIIAAIFTGVALVSLVTLPRKLLSQPGPRSNPRELWQTVKTISVFKALWVLGIFHGIAYAALNNVGNWLPTILSDLEGHTNIERWGMATGFLLLLGTVARATGGELLRWLTRSQLVSYTLFSIAALLLVMGLSGSVWLSFGVGVGLVILSGFTYGTLFSLTSILMPPAVAATSVGFMNMLANVANVTIILILGQGREATGSFSLSFILIGFLALVCWFFGSRILNRELAARDQEQG